MLANMATRSNKSIPFGTETSTWLFGASILFESIELSRCKHSQLNGLKKKIKAPKSQADDSDSFHLHEKDSLSKGTLIYAIKAICNREENCSDFFYAAQYYLVVLCNAF